VSDTPTEDCPDQQCECGP